MKRAIYYLSHKPTGLLYSLLLVLAGFIPSAHGQGIVDQEAIRPIIEHQLGPVEQVPVVTWRVIPVEKGKQDSLKLALLFRHLDTAGGYYTRAQRLMIVELANRVRSAYMKAGMRLLVPAYFVEDYRSYTPYPYFYPAAAAFPKLFLIDKFTQTFGAYELGKLVHWGLVSSGRINGRTPPGRYNFNWQAYHKRSNAAPPGEVWHMYWVFNFYAKIGMHVHQYALPIGTAASHGCIRLARPDAQWNYTWAHGWLQGRNGKLLRNGTPVVVLNANPSGRVAHWALSDSNTVRSLVVLPEDLFRIRTGGIEQRLAPWESGW